MSEKRARYLSGAFHWGVCGVECQVQKEGFRRVLLDVTDGTIPEHVSEVRNRHNGLHAVEQRVRHACAHIDIRYLHVGMAGPEEAIKFFKSAWGAVVPMNRDAICQIRPCGSRRL